MITILPCVRFDWLTIDSARKCKRPPAPIVIWAAKLPPPGARSSRNEVHIYVCRRLLVSFEFRVDCSSSAETRFPDR